MASIHIGAEEYNNKKIEENVRTDFMDYTDLLNKIYLWQSVKSV